MFWIPPLAAEVNRRQGRSTLAYRLVADHVGLRADTLGVSNNSYSYDASPNTADTVVSLQEISAILESAGKSFFRDQRKVLHFIRRCGITLQAAQEQARGMRKLILDLQAERERSGAPTTLSPIDAAKYLPHEELARLAGGIAADSLEAASRSLKEAESTRRSALAELNQLRYLLSTTLESPSFSPDARAEFKRLLSKLSERWPEGAGGSDGPLPAGQQGAASVMGTGATGSAERTLGTVQSQPLGAFSPTTAAPPPPQMAPQPGTPGPPTNQPPPLQGPVVSAFVPPRQPPSQPTTAPHESTLTSLYEASPQGPSLSVNSPSQERSVADNLDFDQLPLRPPGVAPSVPTDSEDTDKDVPSGDLDSVFS